MRAREVEKLLRTGSIITCRECKDCGCDGKPAEVEVTIYSCGCKTYTHTRNDRAFYRKVCGNRFPDTTGWGAGEIKGLCITGRSIKLIRR